MAPYLANVSSEPFIILLLHHTRLKISRFYYIHYPPITSLQQNGSETQGMLHRISLLIQYSDILNAAMTTERAGEEEDRTSDGLSGHNHHQTLETLRDPVIKYGNSNQFHYHTTRGSNGRTIFV